MAAMVEALRRQQGLAGVEQRRREKQSNENGEDDGEAGLITQLRSARKPRRSLSRASAKPRVATGATGTEQKVAGNVA